MSFINATVDLDGPTPFDGYVAARNEAKLWAVRQAHYYYRDEQRRGLISSDDSKNQLFVRAGGRGETRRTYEKFATERTMHYVELPINMRWVSSGEEVPIELYDAGVTALQLLRRRAPERSGNYLRNTSIWLNGSPISLSGFRNADLTLTDRIFVCSATAYSSTIEAGFYTKYYETAAAQSLTPAGIVYPIARIIRKQFAGQVAARFIYIKPGSRHGTYPAVELGVPEAFPTQDAPRPGSSARRQARRARG